MGTHYDNQFPDNHERGHEGRGHHDRRVDFEALRRGAGFPGRGGFGHGFGPGFGGGFGPGFGPGRGGRGRARKGDVRLAILSLLSESPANGYGLMKSIAERTDGVWRPSPGSVYPTLQQLVDEDLIIESGEGRQSTFDLTETGRVYVTEHADEIATAWSDASGDPEFRKDEYWGSVMKLAGVVKQFGTDASPEQRAAGTAKLDELRRALYAILAD